MPAPVETHRIPHLTHVLRRDTSQPSLSHYRKLLREPTDAELLDRVSTWVAGHTSNADRQGRR